MGRMWSAIRMLIMVVSWAAAAGCASQGRSAAKDFKPDAPALDPLELVGQDAVIQIDMNPRQAPTTKRPHELFSGEICRLSLGGGPSVECFPTGSFLLLGPNDGIMLVDQNPLWQLRANGRAGAPREELKLLRFYATLYLICGSIEQLPEALSNYFDDPGPRRRTALSLARRLVATGGADITGVAPGGTFALHFRLTPTGKAKLIHALRSAQDDTEGEFASWSDRRCDREGAKARRQTRRKCAEELLATDGAKMHTDVNANPGAQNATDRIAIGRVRFSGRGTAQ